MLETQFREGNTVLEVFTQLKRYVQDLSRDLEVVKRVPV